MRRHSRTLYGIRWDQELGVGDGRTDRHKRIIHVCHIRSRRELYECNGDRELHMTIAQLKERVLRQQPKGSTNVVLADTCGTLSDHRYRVRSRLDPSRHLAALFLMDCPNPAVSDNLEH